MKGYLALCLVIVLSVGLTKSQKTSLDEKRVQGILENYNKNPTAESKSDLENAFRANCCDAPNNRATAGKYIIIYTTYETIIIRLLLGNLVIFDTFLLSKAFMYS